MDNADTFQLALPGFEGQLPELVDLATRRKVSLAELRLVDITTQFSTHLAAAPAVDLDDTGEFLHQAVKLLLLKSQELLTLEEEHAPQGAVAQASRGPRDAGVLASAVDLAARQGRQAVPGPPRIRFLSPPIEPRAASLLIRAWADMSERAAEPAARMVAPVFVRLETAMSRVIAQVAASRSISLRVLACGSKRPEMVMYFLAVLELLRRNALAVRQAEPFGDILLQRTREAVDDARAG